MNQSRRLIFKGNLLVMFKLQCQAMCMMKSSRDWISSADPVSNLRHIKYAVQKYETEDEKELRKYREELQTWNEIFWTKHNLSFVKEKREFEKAELHKKGAGSEMLSADEISVFYKDFLDKNWKIHLKYLFEWYKRNFYVTYLHFRVNIVKLFKRKDICNR